MPLVTVPCPSCNAKLGLGHLRCPTCGEALPAALRSALQERLASADTDYAEARQSTGRASILLLIVGLLYLVAGGLSFLTERTGSGVAPASTSSTAVLELLGNGALGLTMIACFVASRRAPGVALVVGLVLWLSAQLITFAIAPTNLLRAFLSIGSLLFLLGKALAAFVLIRGALAANQIRQIELREARPD